MNKTTEHHGIERDEPDEEMQAIGFPPPLNPTAFSRRLAEIIERACNRESRKKEGLDRER